MNDARDRRGAVARILRTAAVVLAAALLAAGLAVLFRSLVNRLFLYSYDNGRYSDYPEALARPLAFGENYVVPYNLGSAAYQRGDYPRAIEDFTDALRRRPPEEEVECRVRINLALSMLHDFPFEALDKGDAEQVAKALEALYAARGVLTENGCACEPVGVYDGHSEEAEKLKRDIDEMIRKLIEPPAQPQPQGSGGDDSDEGDPPEDDEPDDEQPDGQQEEQQKAGPAEQDQQERQMALRDQLEEQKQDLEAGSYTGSGARDFTYITTGESFGFGEGVPW